MKRINSLFMALLLVSQCVFFTACSNDDNPEANTPVPQAKENIKFLAPLVVKTQKRVGYTSLLGDDSPLEFQQIVFEYNSYGPDMKTRVRMTGSISMNEDVYSKKVDPSSVLLYNEFTTAKKGERTSQDEIDDMSIYTTKDRQRIVIAADMYGWTLTEDKPQAYCCTGISSKEIIDCYDAAIYILKQRGYNIDNVPLYNVGYSSGALTAMAAQRYIDKYRKDIHFDVTAVGGGPYDLEGVYKTYVETDTTGYMCSLPLMIVAYKETFNLPFSYSDVFQKPLADNIQPWILSKDYGTQEINGLIGPEHHISEVLTPEACDTTSTLGRLLIQKFRENSVCGVGQDWCPNTTTQYYVYHSKGDLYIPVAIGQEMAAYLESHGCNVKTRFDSSGNHVFYAIFTFMGETNRMLK